MGNLLSPSLTRQHILKPALDLLRYTGQSVAKIEISKTDFGKIWDSNISQINTVLEECSPVEIIPSEEVTPGKVILKPIIRGYAINPKFNYSFILSGREGCGPSEYLPDTVFDYDTPVGGLSFKDQIEYSIPIYKILASDQIKANLLIKVKSRHTFCDEEYSNAELKAQNTLRDMLSEADWRRYVTCGFVMIKGAFGNWYQVFRQQKHIIVYNKGKKVNEICIHTDAKCPPTDHIINMKFLIENDENVIWNNGNVMERDWLNNESKRM